MARGYYVNKQGLAPGAFASLRQEVLGSPLLGPTNLVGTFGGTRGFSAVFPSFGLPRLARRFPAIGAYVEQRLARPWAFRTRSLRVGAALPWQTANVFYVNALAIPPGQGVGRHIDATLGVRLHGRPLTPIMVSVLYLQVPRGAGGRLRLYSGTRCLVALRAEENTLVHFDGRLGHEVEALAADSSGERISLVCEQYLLPPDQTATMKPLRVESRAGFAQQLARAGEKPLSASALEIDI